MAVSRSLVKASATFWISLGVQILTPMMCVIRNGEQLMPGWLTMTSMRTNLRMGRTMGTGWTMMLDGSALQSTSLYHSIVERRFPARKITLQATFIIAPWFLFSVKNSQILTMIVIFTMSLMNSSGHLPIHRPTYEYTASFTHRQHLWKPIVKCRSCLENPGAIFLESSQL